MKSELFVVCGAGGFIGGHLVAELRRDGFNRLRAVDWIYNQMTRAAAHPRPRYTLDKLFANQAGLTDSSVNLTPANPPLAPLRRGTGLPAVLPSWEWLGVGPCFTR